MGCMRGRKGAVLIVVLGVLVVLSLLGTAFAGMQAMEKQVTRNHLDTVRAKMMAQSGAQHAEALLRDLFPFRYLDESSPRAWRYWGLDASEGADPAMAVPPPEQVPLHQAKNPSFAVENESPQNPGDFAVAPRPILIDGNVRGYSGAHETGAYGRNGDQFALKVTDLSGLIYVNDGMDIGRNGTVSQNLKRILNLLGEMPAVDIANLGAVIVDNRPVYGYSDLTELVRFLPGGEADLRKIRDYLTVHAWCDADVALPVPLNAILYGQYRSLYKAPPLRVGAAERANFRLGPQSNANNQPAEPQNRDLDTSPPRTVTDDKIKIFGLDSLNPQWVEIVTRAPVNVNSASREVLVVLLAHLRGIFLGDRRRNNPRYSGDLYLSFKQRNTYSPAGTEGDEVGFLRETFPILGVTGSMSAADGISPYAIADEIIACRRRTPSKFRPSFNYASVPWSGVFRSWDQFNKFVDNLVWYDPAKFPQFSGNVGLLKDPRDWFVQDYAAEGVDATGAGAMEVSEYQRAMSSRAIADVLKANFNPNTALNEMNPDENLHHLVDKTDIIVNSTEFNFLPTGYFEVESLGRVLRPLSGEDCAAPNVANRLVAQAKVTAVYRFYDLYRETSMRQFYKGTLVPRPGGAYETNNNMTLEIGWEPDNGVFAGNAGAPGDPDNEIGGYLALPTIGSIHHKVATKPRNALWTTLGNTTNGAHLSDDAMHAHFQLDQHMCNHPFERKEISGSSGNPNEGVRNFSDRIGPNTLTSYDPPYNPTQAGKHRACRSYRNPKIGTGTSGPQPANAGTFYAPSDLRIDGTHVERHAAPAYMLHGQGGSHVWDFQNANTQGLVSFWMKPNYSPEFTGKVRTMFDISRGHATCASGVNIFPFAIWFFPAHYNPSVSESGRPDYWANNMGKFHPMSLTWGSKQWHDLPSGYYEHRFGDMSRSLNHTAHPDDGQKPNLLKAHKWMNVAVWWNMQGRYTSPSSDVHRMWINGSRTYVGWTHQDLWEGGSPPGHGKIASWERHGNGAGNHLRLGGTSWIGSGTSGAQPTTYPGNHSGDHTLDEFYAWRGIGTQSSAGFLCTMVDPATLWKRGRYYNYMFGGGTGDAALPRFTSAPFALAQAGGYRTPPPASSVAPPGGTGAPPPPTGGSGPISAAPTALRVLGIQWTWFGEPLDERITPYAMWDGKPVLYDYSGTVDGSALKNVRPLVQVRLIDGAQIYGPPDNVVDYSPFMAIRDVNGRTPAIQNPAQLKYEVRFRFQDAAFSSILLATPALDDVTVYWDDGRERLISFCMDSRSLQ